MGSIRYLLSSRTHLVYRVFFGLHGWGPCLGRLEDCSRCPENCFFCRTSQNWATIMMKTHWLGWLSLTLDTEWIQSSRLLWINTNPWWHELNVQTYAWALVLKFNCSATSSLWHTMVPGWWQVTLTIYAPAADSRRDQHPLLAGFVPPDRH